MHICDRCGSPANHRVFVCGRVGAKDLCAKCYKELDKINEDNNVLILNGLRKQGRENKMPDPFGEFLDFYDRLNKILKDNSLYGMYPYPIIKDSKPIGSENIMKGGNNMSYSKKAKTAEANADQKDIITIDDIEIVRANEVKEGRVLFDMKVRGINISNMVLQSYTNKEGQEGDILDFPNYKAKNGNYYRYAWFPISKELKQKIIDQVVSLLG